MKKLYVGLIIMGLVPFILTGCWNYKEVTELSIIAGVAVDLTEEGEYQLTFEIVDLHEVGEAGQVKSVLLETKGKSIFDAARNAISHSVPKLYWGHAASIFLSQDIARQGIMDVIDYLCRDSEPRLRINVFVAQTKTAKEILEAEVPTSEIISTEVREILEDSDNLPKIKPTLLYEFIDVLSEKGYSPIASTVDVIEMQDKKTVQLTGTALFKGERLVGFLDLEDTQSLSFILDDVKGGVLMINLGSEDEKVAMEILKSKTKVKPSYNNGRISMEVKIETSLALNEIDSTHELSSERDWDELAKKVQEQLKNQLETFIKKVQMEYGTDSFGFGNKVYKKLPQVWREIEGQWDDLFKDLEVTVTPEVKIHHAGLLKKPIQIGD